MRAPAAHEGNPEDRLSGMRKAAIVVAGLGTELAVKVCSQLDEDYVRLIAEAISALGTVAPEERVIASNDVYGGEISGESLGGRAYARKLLTGTLGANRAAEVISIQDGSAYFSRLADMQVIPLLQTLEQELPQTIALVLSQLPSPIVAEVLQRMPAERKAEVAFAIASLRPPPSGVLREVGEQLCEEARAGTTLDRRQAVNGHEVLIGALTKVDRASEKEILGGLAERDPALAQEIAESLLTFEDLLALDPRYLQVLLRNVDTRVLALALKSIEPADRETVFTNLSTRGRQALEQEIELLGRVRVKDVEEAQGQIVLVARELEEKGEVVLSSGGEADQMVE